MTRRDRTGEPVDQPDEVRVGFDTPPALHVVGDEYKPPSESSREWARRHLADMRAKLERKQP